MPAIDPTYQPRLWRCDECRNILGIVLRDQNRVRRLWVLRIQTPDETTINGQLPGLILIAQGVRHARYSPFLVYGMDAGNVGCNACSSVQEWRASDEALFDLIRKVVGDHELQRWKKIFKPG